MARSNSGVRHEQLGLSAAPAVGIDETVAGPQFAVERGRRLGISAQRGENAGPVIKGSSFRERSASIRYSMIIGCLSGARPRT